MFRNYLAVAWRNLWKNKSFSAINILGLALGITCSLLIVGPIQLADEKWAELYQKEKVIQQLSNYFAFLGIFISCLGLLGLVMFTAGQRACEISIWYSGTGIDHHCIDHYQFPGHESSHYEPYKEFKNRIKF